MKLVTWNNYHWPISTIRILFYILGIAYIEKNQNRNHLRWASIFFIKVEEMFTYSFKWGKAAFSRFNKNPCMYELLSAALDELPPNDIVIFPRSTRLNMYAKIVACIVKPKVKSTWMEFHKHSTWLEEFFSSYSWWMLLRFKEKHHNNSTFHRPCEKLQPT